MKTSALRLITLAAVTGFSAFAVIGCSKADRNTASAKTSEVMADTKNALGNAWDNVKSYSFDKKDDFTANAKAVTSKMDAQISDLRANYSEAKASASRKSAMNELKNSEADYKEKVDRLGQASAATWDSAKQNVIASWDRLQAAYYKARAE